MKMAQLLRVKPKVGVFRNIAARTKVRVVTLYQHAAHAGLLLQVFKHRAQRLPHGPRHGVKACRVAERDLRHALSLLQQYLTRHGRAQTINPAWRPRP